MKSIKIKHPLLLFLFFTCHAYSWVSASVQWTPKGKEYTAKITEADSSGDNQSYVCAYFCKVWLVSTSKKTKSEVILSPNVAEINDKELAALLKNKTVAGVSPEVNPGEQGCLFGIIGSNLKQTQFLSGCGIVPKKPVTCEISHKTISFDYGDVAFDKVAGNSLSNKIKITCSDKATLKVIATDTAGGSNQIKLSDELLSSLTIDNVNGLKGVTISDTKATSVTLTSTLSVNGTLVSGPKNGSGLLKVEID